MLFRSTCPNHKELKKYIQYILFNKSTDAANKSSFTSFPNNNITLCIVQGKQVIRDVSSNSYQEKKAITSYLTGLYMKPNSFHVEGELDEICIEFTVAGYYRFFPFPSRKFMLTDDILTEAFGKESVFFFENVFEEPDFDRRADLIESFLARNLRDHKTSFIENVINSIDHYGFTKLEEVKTYFNCSEKKLYRAFKEYYELSPKEYLQLLRFRRSLMEINDLRNHSLTDISYKCGYYDQSHFIKEFKRFSDTNPKILRDQIRDIDGNVLITVS
ncbi:helix-turn-helix domain-containing protein [Leptobacterium flavescens]|uniref:Helix-turn-helix domain-containing protein n=1 Tax=Leptobacterium flavescens TaxID=472055 RepID=A0A6P0UFS2_9FLAO|nr:helix-turn-helix domain-containing protein [Leptobacterium flavescens]NER12085.1 helix-turn-helix domain-containing protein [Leptobacterium flavescens]